MPRGVKPRVTLRLDDYREADSTRGRAALLQSPSRVACLAHIPLGTAKKDLAQERLDVMCHRRSTNRAVEHHARVAFFIEQVKR